MTDTFDAVPALRSVYWPASSRLRVDDNNTGAA